MEIYATLKKDHDKLKILLDRLVHLSQADEGVREDLIQEIRDELVPHSRAEEAVLYNSLRDIDMANELAMHGYKEHMEAEAVLRTLQVQEKIDADWTKTARKLKESLEHHIEEEEGRIFSAARQLFTEEEAMLMGEAFEKMKPEVKEGSFLQNTLDMVANMMPTRFAASLRTYLHKPH